MLALHPKICALNNPAPNLRTEGFVLWSNPSKSLLIQKRIRKKRWKLVEQIKYNGFIYVESTIAGAFLISELDKIFDAKFIHLYRDGREFVRSGLHRNWYRPLSIMEHIKNYLRRNFFIETGRSTLDEFPVPPGNCKTQIEKIAWRWVEINRIIIDKISLLPEDKKFSLKLEELDSDKLKHLLEFIGASYDKELITKMLEFAQTKPNKTELFRVPSFDRWDEKEKQQFWKVAREMMNILGYPVESNL